MNETMKKTIYFLIFILMMTSVLAVGNPYPVYGKTNPDTKIMIVGNGIEKSTISSAEGDYLIDLDSSYSKVVFKVKACSEEAVLPVAASYRYDTYCDQEIPTGALVAGVTAGAGAIGAGVYYALKKKKAKKVATPKKK